MGEKRSELNVLHFKYYTTENCDIFNVFKFSIIIENIFNEMFLN